MFPTNDEQRQYPTMVLWDNCWFPNEYVPGMIARMRAEGTPGHRAFTSAYRQWKRWAGLV